MVRRGRGGVRGKGGGGPSGARGGLRASFVASMNNSHLDTKQSNGQWKNSCFEREVLQLTCEARIHSITFFLE